MFQQRTSPKKFVSLRNQRRFLVGNEVVPGAGSSKDTKCEKAEAQLEMIEGVANYIDLSAATVIGLISTLQLFENIGDEKDNSSFYKFGAMQLLFLEKVFPGDLKRITQRLVSSIDYTQGIHYEFQNMVKLNIITLI